MLTIIPRRVVIRLCGLLLLPLCSPASPALAETILVPDDFPTIQGAIDQATDGDVILVDPGTYVETIDFLGKAITVRGTDCHANTVIDGGGNTFFAVVTCDTGEGPETVLQGFTITGGAFGGMYNASAVVKGSELPSSPTVIDCRFEFNASPGAGGAVLNVGFFDTPVAATFIDCDFVYNSAQSGGGMLNSFATVTLERCSFVGNTAEGDGGGLSNLHNSHGNLVDCVFEGNGAGAIGGGMNNLTSDPILVDCVFANNVASGPIGPGNGVGGAIHTQYGSPQIVNSLFTNNSAAFGGAVTVEEGHPAFINCTFSQNAATGLSPTAGAIWIAGIDTTTVTNSILWGNVPNEINASAAVNVTYSNVEGGYPGEGNIGEDPGDAPDFVDVSSGDFTLLPGSAGEDEGNSAAVPAGVEEDLRGVPRIVSTAVDMGAYECLLDPCTLLCAPVFVDCNGNGVPDTCDVAIGDPSSDCNGNFVPDECESGGTIDIIFVVDGSGSIDENEWTLQKEGIVDCLNGPDAVIPADGSASIAVIQFSDVECIPVPLTVIDSAVTAEALATTIEGLELIESSTQLAIALERAFEIFRDQGTGAVRQLFITTDAGFSTSQDADEALEQCRRLGEELGVKICTGLVGDFLPDAPELMMEFANATNPPETTRPVGSYRLIPPMTPDEIGALCLDCVETCSADINGDGVVNVTDLVEVILAWGVCECCPADTNLNGVVDVVDLLAVILTWGPCPGSALPPNFAGDPPSVEDAMDCMQRYGQDRVRLNACLESK